MRAGTQLGKDSKCPFAFYPCGEVGKAGSDPDIHEGGTLFQALEAKFKGKNETKRYSTMHHGFVSRGNIKPSEFNAGTGEEVKIKVQECVEDIGRFFMRHGLVSAFCCPPGSAPYLAADHIDEGSVKSHDGVSFHQVGSGSAGLLLLPDVWGWNGGRTRAIADELAKKGLSVYVPKILPAYQGGTDHDGLPPNFNVEERGAELGPLLGGDWNSSKAVPRCLKVLEAMDKAGIKKKGTLGTCYDGWFAMKLACF